MKYSMRYLLSLSAYRLGELFVIEFGVAAYRKVLKEPKPRTAAIARLAKEPA